MLGGCVSLIVMVNEQLGPDVVLQVTVVVPTGKNEPDAGEQVTVPQPADAVGANVTTAPHWFGSLDRVMFAGQVITQGTTVTVKLQLAEFPAQSQASQFTVVVPTGNVEPDGGVQVVTPGVHLPAGLFRQTNGQLSITVGAG
jgi:hypothetical protein